MNTSENLLHQLQHVLRKMKVSLSSSDEFEPLTDLLFQWVEQEGVLVVSNDEDAELGHGRIDEWVEAGESLGDDDMIAGLRDAIVSLKPQMEALNVMKPYAFVWLKDDEGETAEVYRVDDENIVIEETLMKDLDSDLDAFWAELSKE